MPAPASPIDNPIFGRLPSRAELEADVARSKKALADLFAFSGYDPTPEQEAAADAEIFRQLGRAPR